MKRFLKQEKGISLISLGITVLILIVLTSTLIYNAKDRIYIERLNNLYNDIEQLREKVFAFHNEFGKIPAKTEYTLLEESGLKNVLSDKEKVNKFYVIDLQTLENLTLNYGRDYEYVKDKTLTGENEYKDIYIINSYSYNVFYVQGVDIAENEEIKKYYTDYIEPDNTQIDLRYVSGVIIPEGYYYIGDNEDGNIVISDIKDENVDLENKLNQYKWIKTNKVPESAILKEEQDKTEFEMSIQVYGGYYINNSNNVIYIIVDENIWSETYTVTKEYIDDRGDGVYIPEGFKVSMSPTMNKLDTGLVIQDENGNEWVWIEVPEEIFITANHNKDYNSIEADLIEYAKEYRNGSSEQDFDWKDEWYAIDGDTLVTQSTPNLTSRQKALNNGCGLTYDEYINLYQTMLKSVYENNGFWISRYEIGDKESTENNKTRTSSFGITNTPVSKSNQIPYNFVTCSQAQSLASQMKTANKTTSLLFGIQRDLVCKFLEESTDLKTDDISLNSSSWGNYSDSSLLLYKGKYNINPGSSTSTWKEYTVNTENYVINKQTSSNESFGQLLTTGASKMTNKMNIYDFAGNQWEWTLEKTDDTSNPCVPRGGSWGNSSSVATASFRSTNSITSRGTSIGFRVALY